MAASVLLFDQMASGRHETALIIVRYRQISNMFMIQRMMSCGFYGEARNDADLSSEM